MNEPQEQQKTPSADGPTEAASLPDTKHEPHEHASRRVRMSLIALVVVAALVVVWMNWGEDIKEYCFGEDGACPVEIDPALLEEQGVDFGVSEEEFNVQESAGEGTAPLN